MTQLHAACPPVTPSGNRIANEIRARFRVRPAEIVAIDASKLQTADRGIALCKTKYV